MISTTRHPMHRCYRRTIFSVAVLFVSLTPVWGQRPCTSGDLIGKEWHGSHAGFVIDLTFDSGGEYSYWIGTGNRAYLTVKGTFTIEPDPDYQEPHGPHRPQKPCLITLTRKSVGKRGSDMDVQRLDDAGLMGLAKEEYRYHLVLEQTVPCDVGPRDDCKTLNFYPDSQHETSFTVAR